MLCVPAAVARRFLQAVLSNCGVAGGLAVVVVVALLALVLVLLVVL